MRILILLAFSLVMAQPVVAQDHKLATGPVAGQCVSFSQPNGIFTKREIPTVVRDDDFTDGMGRKKLLSDFKGTPLLVNFWNTYCPPCVIEMPSLARLQKHYGLDHLRVLPVNRNETAMHVASFYQKHELYELKIYTDRFGKLAKANNIGALPTTVFVDGDGREIGRLKGMVEWDTPEMLDHLTSCLGLERSDPQM